MAVAPGYSADGAMRRFSDYASDFLRILMSRRLIF